METDRVGEVGPPVGPSMPRPERGRLRAAGLALLYVPVLAAGVAWIAIRGGWSAFRDSLAGGQPWPSLALGLLGGLVVALALHGSPLARTREYRRMRRFFRGLLPEVSPFEAMALALASGFGEEILFRGAIQPALGIWWTSLLFGLLHFPPDRRLIGWPIFAGVLGLAFGGVYDLTGNLLGPIVAHVTINYVGLRRLASGRRPHSFPG